MVLYTCGEGTRTRSCGGLLGHPCGRAAEAVDDTQMLVPLMIDVAIGGQTEGVRHRE